ncbi:hypothetical protein BDW42DRAFT_175920, partial [Aspergillus taichungensis]
MDSPPQPINPTYHSHLGLVVVSADARLISPMMCPAGCDRDSIRNQDTGKTGYALTWSCLGVFLGLNLFLGSVFLFPPRVEAWVSRYARIRYGDGDENRKEKK